MNSYGEKGPIKKNNLENHLRKSINEKIEVIDFVTSPLLPKGENHGSVMLKLGVTIKKNRGSLPEKLNLVAKTVLFNEIQKTYSKQNISFSKEIYVFENLIPHYKQIEMEAGVKVENTINILPKHYGSQFIVNEETGNITGDTYILMEDLKVRDYYIADRIAGWDLEHAKKVIVELARFHALGIATKCKTPLFFQRAKSCLDICKFDRTQDYSGYNNAIINGLFADSRIARHDEQVRKCLTSKDLTVLMDMETTEPWATLAHLDVWVNNVMFHKENGVIDDVKIFDFPMTRYCNATRDLIFTIFISSNEDVLNKHIDELLNLYFNRFIKVLEKTGCDTVSFSRQKFNEQINIDASYELFHVLISLKWATWVMDPEEDYEKQRSEHVMKPATALYLERAWNIISVFLNRKWM